MAHEKENLPLEDGSQEKVHEVNENIEKTLSTSESTLETTENLDKPLIQSEKIEVVETPSKDIEKKEVPVKDYKSLSIANLVEEFQFLIRSFEPNLIKNQVNDIREQFKLKTDEEYHQKEADFIKNGGDQEAFSYKNPHHHPFSTLIGDFKTKLQAFYKNVEKQQKNNLKERLVIIDELKALYLDQNPDHHHTFKQFRTLRDRWDKAGFVPKNEVTNVFKTYYHHLDNYYEYLKLNKGLEELEHKNNLELKNNLIHRAKELQKENNLQKAFNELQFLHKKWKEVGPVDREFREQKWQEFKEATRVVHDRKHELNEQYKIEQTKNLAKKREIIELINQLTVEEVTSHQKWQQKIKLLEELRTSFLKLGRVPKEFNDIIWAEFKQSTRKFNHTKNHYYKSLKNDQQQNLELKNALLEQAKALQNSTDWNATSKKLIDIQAKWKKIGHVPRKHSDKIWKEFKNACNNFFDRYHSLENEKEQAFVENYRKKVAFIEKIKAEKLETDKQKVIQQVNQYNQEWKTLGKVPKNKMNINKEFDTITSNLLASLDISKVELEDIKLDNLINQIITDEDQHRLNDEIQHARKKIQDLDHEIAQLENNLAFFSNAKDDNPLLKNAKDNISKHKEDHLIWSKRYSKLIKVHFEKLEE
ncbi:MAG: DUF349 domain-containing protein [Flavobacteriales bacterium]